jgi:hypothetical protein
MQRTFSLPMNLSMLQLLTMTADIGCTLVDISMNDYFIDFVIYIMPSSMKFYVILVKHVTMLRNSRQQE